MRIALSPRDSQNLIPKTRKSGPHRQLPTESSFLSSTHARTHCIFLPAPFRTFSDQSLWHHYWQLKHWTMFLLASATIWVFVPKWYFTWLLPRSPVFYMEKKYWFCNNQQWSVNPVKNSSLFMSMVLTTWSWSWPKCGVDKTYMKPRAKLRTGNLLTLNCFIWISAAKKRGVLQAARYFSSCNSNFQHQQAAVFSRKKQKFSAPKSRIFQL